MTLPALPLALLEKWRHSIRPWFHFASPGQAFYGTGDHSTWAIQSSATACSALAVLAMKGGLEESEQIREEALALFRYLLATHVSSEGHCTSGKSWGHSWITVLGYTRMFHAIPLMEPYLSAEERESLRRVTLSEADFLLEGYPVVAAIDAATGRNKPESNLWNGAFLYRAAGLYPNADRAAEYREEARALLLNSISIPSDAISNQLYHDRPLSQWHVGPNFTESYGLHHHGYLNVGYMVICLSNVAMAHYAFEDAGIAPPPELYHHAQELWQRIKMMTFDDGRLWRIGGDTRVRYCYCQDYAIPMWLMAWDLWGDCDAQRYLSRWLDLVATEQSQNRDGAFLSARLADLAAESPLYYTRLEGDRAVSLSMAACWADRIEARQARQTAPIGTQWDDEFHGATMVRGERYASWVWKGAGGPLGTVVPADRSDLAEWKGNLAGIVAGQSGITTCEGEQWESATFQGGFLTSGSLRWIESHVVAEGSFPNPFAQSQIVCVALPDDQTVVVLQRAKTTRPVYLKEAAGLGLKVPNDLYNESKRRYRFAGEERTLPGATADTIPSATLLPLGDKLAIDDCLHITALYGGELALQRRGKRQVNLTNPLLQHSGLGGNLHCDEVVIPFPNATGFHPAEAPLYHIGALLSLTGRASARRLESAPEATLLEITDGNGKRYLLAQRWDETPLSLPVEWQHANVVAETKSLRLFSE